MSLSFVASATSTAATITIPASAQEGDIGVLFDYCAGGDPDTTPAGWTQIDTASVVGEGRISASYKVLEAGDPNTAITGLDSTVEDKVMFVFRPNGAILAVTPAGWNGEFTSGDPAAQSVMASGGAVPLVVLAAAAQNASTQSFTTASPAFDDTVLNSDSDIIAGYKIYNASPADHTVDSADLGASNGLISGYLQVSFTEGDGSAAGQATVSGIGGSTAQGVGASAGQATVSGVGAGVVLGEASAAGEATVSGVGVHLHTGVGAAAGVASVSGVGFSLHADTIIRLGAVHDGVAELGGEHVEIVQITAKHDGTIDLTGAVRSG